jgi:hypothetical protein
MSAMSANLLTLLNVTCGQELPGEERGRARRLQLIVLAALASLVFAGLWGLAAGSGSFTQALDNLYKVPMVVLLSALSAVPAGMLTWKLIGVRYSGTDLLTGFATGVFGGTLVLGVLAPLVGIYYHTSAWAGPMLAMGSVFAALFVATLVFLRNVMKRVPSGVKRRVMLAPVAVFLFMQMATLVQFIAMASPILPEITVFDGGIDHMVQK